MPEFFFTSYITNKSSIISFLFWNGNTFEIKDYLARFIFDETNEKRDSELGDSPSFVQIILLFLQLRNNFFFVCGMFCGNYIGNILRRLKYEHKYTYTFVKEKHVSLLLLVLIFFALLCFCAHTECRVSLRLDSGNSIGICLSDCNYHRIINR